MRHLLVLALLAVPAPAEWLSFEITFEGTGCTACAESLPSRLQRMRGVETATVDLAKSVLTMKMIPGNRVRIELVRDQIEQDGTKVKSARLTGMGTVVQEAGKWTFLLTGLNTSYPVEIPAGSANRLQTQVARSLSFAATAVRPTVVLSLLE